MRQGARRSHWGRRRIFQRRRLRCAWSTPLWVSPAREGNPLPPAASEAGLTLVECLVSITTVTLAGALVGPPLLLASATQLQAQRVQQAQHLAQAEIDRVRSRVQQSAIAGLDLNELPPVSASSPLHQQSPPQAIAGVRSTHAHCPAYEGFAQADEAIAIDVDGDQACDPEFMLQAVRTGSSSEDDLLNTPFELTVRVYAAPKEHFEALQTEIAPIGLGQGITRRPLAIATALIAPTDRPAALLCYHQQCPE